MDGTSRTVLHSTGLNSPYGLTIDYENQILYWIDYSYDRVESSYANGTSRVVLTNSSISQPQDIAYFGGNVYWTDRGYDRIYSASVDPVTVTIVRSFTNPYGISVFSEEGQPEGIYVFVPWQPYRSKLPHAVYSLEDYVHCFFQNLLSCSRALYVHCVV